MSKESRLADDARTVTYTESVEIVVGYHRCGVCNVETPEPTTEQLLARAKNIREGYPRHPRPSGYLWPGLAPYGEQFMPAGWSNDYDLGIICPACTAAKREAFAQRRKVSR